MPYVTLGQRLETRRNNFDFLRFFFASLVILSHSYLLLTPDGLDREPLWRATGLRETLGALSVAGFFAISGFLITQSWLRTPQVRNYAKKRALRIYPGWIVALVFCVLVVGPILRPDHTLQFGNSATFGFLSQLVLHDAGQLKTLPGISGAINGSTWTIPFELMCYVMVAVLGLLGLFRRPVLLLVFTLALVLGMSLWPPQALRQVFHPSVGSPHIPYYRFAFVAYFLSGALFFLFRDRIPHSRPLLAFSAVLVGLTLFRLPLAGLFFVILPTFGFYILFYLAFLPLGSLHNWAKHGDFSYGVYLYAYPIQRLLVAEQFRGFHLSPPDPLPAGLGSGLRSGGPELALRGKALPEAQAPLSPAAHGEVSESPPSQHGGS